MTITRATPGTPIALSARDWNQLAETAERAWGGNATAPGLSAGFPIHIKNTSADDITRGQILGLDGPLYTQADRAAEFLNRPTFKGVKPQSPTHIGKWALTLEPIAAGKFGRCALDGLLAVPLTVNYSTHPYADIAHNSYALTSNWAGSAEILWTQATSGSTFGLIRLAGFKSALILGTASGTITAGSYGTVNITGTSPTQTISAYLDHADGGQNITTGKEVFCTFNRLANRWQITGAQCE